MMNFSWAAGFKSENNNEAPKPNNNKNCANLECSKFITNRDELVECAGQCRKVYHAKCAGIEVADLIVLNKYDSFAYKCEKCANFEMSTMEMFRSIQQKLNSLEQRTLSSQSSVTVQLSERINRIEKIIAKSGDEVVNGMSKVVDEVKKVVVDKSSEMSKMLMNGNDDGWKTVVKKKNGKNINKVVIIKPTNKDKPRLETERQLRKTIDASTLKINGMNGIAENGLAIRCEDEKSCDKMINEIKSKFGDEFVVRKPHKVTPRIKILKVNDPEMCDDEFVKQLKKQNDETVVGEIEIVRREQVKRNGKDVVGVFNMVVQVDELSYENIMKEKKLKHQFQRYHVVDNIYIRRCYKCCGFNHNASDCRNEQSCSSCAGNHKYNECTSSIKKCINCVKCNERSGAKYDVNHSVWSNECAIYKLKLARSKRGLNHIQ